jgi:hypothetical protein
MADTAAFCIDHLFPKVPVRQFVLTVPMRLRFRMAASPRLTSAVLRCFIAAVASDLRRRARRLGFRGQLRTGAMTVVQRFGSSLALNVHFHTLAVDGVWTTQADGSLDFHPLPAPTDRDVARIARAVCRKVQRMTTHGKDDDEQPSLLDTLANASAQGLVATGPRRGWRVLRLGCAGDAAQAQIPSKRCAEVAGFNVHANTGARAHDRKRLEVLVKYLARPPIAHDRLSKLPDGRLALQFKQPWKDGTTHVVFTAQELIEKLIPLIPRPRSHVIRYHGILGPAAKDRHKIVSGSGPVQYGREIGQPKPHQIDASPRLNHLPWAVLLKRVFLVDVLECPKCKGRMEILAVVTKPASVRRYLEGMDLPSEAPCAHVARPPPQEDSWESTETTDDFYADPPSPED